MRRIVASAICGLLSGLTACVTAGEIDERLGPWIGKDPDALAEAWGAPTGAYEAKDGSRILTYQQSEVYTTGPVGFQRTDSRHCDITFKVGKSGLIDAVQWRGQAVQCDRYIPVYGYQPRRIRAKTPEEKTDAPPSPE